MVLASTNGLALQIPATGKALQTFTALTARQLSFQQTQKVGGGVVVAPCLFSTVMNASVLPHGISSGVMRE